MDSSSKELDFAYKYQFSKEARKVIAQDQGSVSPELAKAGRIRVDEDLNSDYISYYGTEIEEVQKRSVLSYVYSRMVVSALGSRMFIAKYAKSEASRAMGALESESLPNIMKLSDELGMEMGYSEGMFIMHFAKFLMISSKSPELSLVKQSLDRGIVHMERQVALRLMECAIASEIAKRLPIPLKDIPRAVAEEAKQVRLPRIAPAGPAVQKGSYRWVEQILSTPIPDIRHRTVNLILAPYLVNIKGLGEDEAAKVIIEYIDRCRQLNPDTRINESYIKYQCRYAKAKGMKPLSMEKARELYEGMINIG